MREREKKIVKGKREGERDGEDKEKDKKRERNRRKLFSSFNFFIYSMF